MVAKIKDKALTTIQDLIFEAEETGDFDKKELLEYLYNFAINDMTEEYYYSKIKESREVLNRIKIEIYNEIFDYLNNILKHYEDIFEKRNKKYAGGI